MNEISFLNSKKTLYMKSNKYSDLIKFGLKPRTLMTLSESDVDRLHKSLIRGKKKKETTEAQVTTKTEPTKVVTGIKPGDVVPTGGASAVQFVNSTTAELKNSEVKESGSNKKNSPWAICHDELGPKKTAKFERCVRDVKKSIKEGKQYFDILLERKIVSLLEQHMSPKMTKGDLMRLIESKKQTMKKPIGKIGSFGVKTEDKDSDTKTKPKTKPGTKTPPKEKPHDPFKPSPHKQPKPKAKTETKEAVMDAPAKPKTAPTTKPGTKTPPREKPHDPFKPSPHKQPKPKAGRKLPSWLTFNSLGIKFKK
jgi:hypothetical protein